MSRRYFNQVPAFTGYGGDQAPVDHMNTPVQVAQYQNWMRTSQGMGQSVVSSAVANAAAAQVRGIRINTQISPEIEWSPSAGAQPTGSSTGDWFLANVVKPQVSLDTPAGVMTVAPYGPPSSNYFPLMVLAALAGLGTMGWLIYRGIRR